VIPRSWLAVTGRIGQDINSPLTGLAKGYKLGVESSSDHVSTHSSYTLIYTPSMDRTDIIESMRKRHAHWATDNIIVDFQAVDENGTRTRCATPLLRPPLPTSKLKCSEPIRCNE
jgi:hypothetical protein